MADPADGLADRRPLSVTAAGVVALGACLLTATYAVVVLVTLLTEDDPLPEGFGVTTAVSTLVVVLLWCAVAMVLAWLTLQGSRGARIALVVSAALSGSLALTVSVLLAGAVLTMAACVATMVLLFSASARQWFRRPSGLPAG